MQQLTIHLFGPPQFFLDETPLKVERRKTLALLAYLVGNVIVCAGLIFLIIGIIVTAPFGALIYIYQYERVKPA